MDSLSSVTDPDLARILARLVDAYRPERVWLFGSKARGDAGPDSDYDLLVLVPDDAPPELRTARRACEVLWTRGGAADVLVWPRSRFERGRDLTGSLAGTDAREGKLLRAA